MRICLDYGLVWFRRCPKEFSEILIPIKLFENVEAIYESKACKWKDLVWKLFKPREIVQLNTPLFTMASQSITDFEIWFSKWRSCLNSRLCKELYFQGAKWNSIHALVVSTSNNFCSYNLLLSFRWCKESNSFLYIWW